MTGADGRFVFRDLPKGSFMLTSTKGGYLSGAYGRLRPGGGVQALELEGGQRVGVVTLPMWKHAAISGSIVDEAGEPVIGIPVRVMRRTMPGERRRFINVGGSLTDDRGMYRVPMLIPGESLVSVASTQVALPASTVEEYTRTVQTGSPPNDPSRASLQQALFEAGGGGGMMPAGSPLSIQVGNVVQTLGRSAIPPPVGPDGRVFGYPTLFYPRSPSIAKAELITVASGDDRTGVDMQLRPVPILRSPAPLSGPMARRHTWRCISFPRRARWGRWRPTQRRLSPIATAPSRCLVSHRAGTLLRTVKVPRPVYPNTGTTTIVQSGTGGMTMSTMGVEQPPAPPPMPTDPTLWAEVPLSVGRLDVTDLTIPLRTGLRVSGRVEFDGTKEKPAGAALTRMTIMLEPIEGRGPTGPPGGQVDAGLQFKTYGVPAGKYFVGPMGLPPSGWTFKAAMYQGRDVADVPLDLDSADVSGVVITFTDQPTELSGTVESSSGVDPSATVIVFPSDNTAWTRGGIGPRRMRPTRAGATGSYKFTGLPAGTYYVAAVPDELVSGWLDPKFLETVSRTAARVTLDDGDRKTQNVRTTRIR